MLDIDGSYLEGGGQIVRTTLALSTVTGTPVRIFNIRRNRPVRGLKKQHLAVVDAFCKVFGAKVKGGEIGSREIEFIPRKKQGREQLDIDIGSAGSIGLLLQSLTPAVVFSDNLNLSLSIKGGTSGKWAIPCDYYPYVVFPVLGIDAELSIVKRGYYPKGGGRVRLVLASQELKKKELLDRGKVLKIGILSFASSQLKPRNVARRQLSAAENILREKFKDVRIEGKSSYVETPSLGSEVDICAYFDNSMLWADSLGEKGKTSEEVAGEACAKIIEEIESGACIDRHLADNIIPYMAFLGGSFKTSMISKHTLTNIWAVERFLGKKFTIEQNIVSAL